MDSGNPRSGTDPSSNTARLLGLALAGLWPGVLWIAGIYRVLGWPEGVLATLFGWSLLALFLGAGRLPAGPGVEAWALAVPVGMLWSLNHRALGFWWLGDDPCHLVQVLDKGIWRPFVDPTGYFLTPLLNFSLGVDLELFGPAPGAFYAHQLVSFTVLLGVAYAFLRRDLDPADASLALTLFVASSPAVAVAQQQMNRHYLEGAVLILASFALYRRSLASGRLWTAVLGAGLYLLSAAAKEVFVPLVLLLPFWGSGTARDGDGGIPGARWRHAVPYAVALGFYGLWRLIMLGWGNSLVAYGALSGPFDHAALLRRIPRLLGMADGWQSLLAGAVLMAAAWTLWRRSRRFAAALGVALVVLALPLVPVAGRLEPRHFFLAAFGATAVVAAAVCSDLSQRSRPALLRAAAGIGLLTLTLHALTLAPIWTSLEDSSRHHRAEGRFLLDRSRDGVLLTTVQHSHHLQCLARVGRERLGLTEGPGFCGDFCYCSRAFSAETFWEVSGGRIVPAEERPPAGCDARRPLRVDMRHDRRRDRLSWDLGPYADGSYHAILLFAPERGVSLPIPIPQQGEMPYRLTEPLRFVMRYDAPGGWRTYSPAYVVEPGGRAQEAVLQSSVSPEPGAENAEDPTTP